MQAIRGALLSVVALIASALPAAAQTMAGAPTDNGSGGSLVFVWGWILIAGVIIFIVGTSLGVRSGRK